MLGGGDDVDWDFGSVRESERKRERVRERERDRVSKINSAWVGFWVCEGE